MAEKNTLSILESIKQKMAKFDEKDTKSITAFDNDFDYPAHADDNANTSQKKPEMNFIHDHKEENDKVNNDDFLFEHEKAGDHMEDKTSFLHEDEDDDLDLEDEIEEEIEEEDDEDMEEKTHESNAETHDIDDNDEDFIMSKEDNSKKLNEEEDDDQGEDLDLGDDIDLDNKNEIEEVKKPQEQAKAVEVKEEHYEEDEEEDFDEDEKDDDDDLDDLDIDLDEFDKDDTVKEPTMKAVPMHVEEKMTIPEEPEIKIEDKVKVGASANDDEDEDFEEIDLDLGDNLKEENVTKTNQVIMPEPQKSTGYNQAINIPINSNSLDNNHNHNTISAIPSRKTPTTSRPLLNEETLQQSTNSIKKLIDANNVVQGIKSFTEQNNSALNELAVQLMESRLERWLNDHLPDLVEKVVRDEIKKIIPKE